MSCSLTPLPRDSNVSGLHCESQTRLPPSSSCPSQAPVEFSILTLLAGFSFTCRQPIVSGLACNTHPYPEQSDTNQISNSIHFSSITFCFIHRCAWFSFALFRGILHNPRIYSTRTSISNSGDDYSGLFFLLAARDPKQNQSPAISN